jgi:hypothetical protein
LEFLKNALLAATFLLWGIIQLMPRNATSIRLGNVVIVLYVLDLSWGDPGLEDFPKNELKAEFTVVPPRAVRNNIAGSTRRRNTAFRRLPFRQ